MAMEDVGDSGDAQLKDALKTLAKAVGDLGKAVSSEVGQHKPEMVNGLADGLRQAADKLNSFGASVGQGRTAASERARHTRAELLEAAAKVFAAKGFERASMDDVAKAAGFTKGALYAHFSSKFELTVALTEEFTAATEPLPEPGQLPGLLGQATGDAACQELGLTIEILALALRDQDFRERVSPCLARSREGVARQVAANRGAPLGGDGLPEVTEEDREAAVALTALVAAARMVEQMDPSQLAGPLASRLAARFLDATRPLGTPAVAHDDAG